LQPQGRIPKVWLSIGCYAPSLVKRQPIAHLSIMSIGIAADISQALSV
jgi:hypothetical protein